jgi:thymidylate kinase
LALLPLPALVVYLQAPVDLALDRYCGRESRRLVADARNGLSRQFSQAEKVCDELLEACRKAGSAIVTVDACDSRSEVAAERAFGAIRKRIDQART